MLIDVALRDGFEGDTVVLLVDGVVAYRGEGVTTRTQISHAGGAQIEVPDGPFILEVEVPTRDVRESLPHDPHTHPHVALSLIDGRIVPAYPEHLGVA